MQYDDEVCLCFHVTKRKIVNFIRIERPRRVSQVAECYGAGTGCGWCRTMIQRFFDAAVEDGGAVPDEPSREEYAKARSRYIREGGGTPPPGATPIDDDAEE